MLVDIGASGQGSDIAASKALARTNGRTRLLTAVAVVVGRVVSEASVTCTLASSRRDASS